MLRQPSPEIPLNDGVVLEYAKDYAFLHGLGMRTADTPNESEVIEHAPFALYPSYFPKALHLYAQELQKEMLDLYYRVSQDRAFIVSVHKELASSDVFIKRLLSVYEEVTSHPFEQMFELIIQRSDYMAHINSATKQLELKQVEVNNIAVSMGGLGQVVSSMHQNIMDVFYKHVTLNQSKLWLPQNNKPAEMCAEGLVQGLKLYHVSNHKQDSVHGMFIETRDLTYHSAYILVIVEDVNRNQFDQRHIEMEIQKQSRGLAKILREPLSKLHSRLHLDANKKLILDEKYEIGLVYWRTGYSENQYNGEMDWCTRLLIEKSAAVKCPSVALQLANTKKMQQVLSDKSILKKYLKEDSKLDFVHQCFAGLWALGEDSEECRHVVEDAITHPSNYVLKPQTEGGGGNYFDEDIPRLLQSLTQNEMKSYILMQKLSPLIVENYLVRSNKDIQKTKVVSELGIYGYLIVDKSGTYESQFSDVYPYMMRTKEETTREGGICIGAACLDSMSYQNFTALLSLD
uniref:Glutathione synthetase n=1 Tax=Rhabditophanes sp. KR3021 TaxID=114890 RepID=A0AC35TT70_9BILA